MIEWNRAAGERDSPVGSSRQQVLEGDIMKDLIKKFGGDDRGMETVEWAIMAALIVAGTIAVVAGIGANVSNALTALKTGTTP